MKKDIYKKVPQKFHDQLCQTLEHLDDTCEKNNRICFQKYAIIFAAVVLACMSLTAGAAGLMKWHSRTSERFRTEKELEDKLTMEKVTISQSAEIQEYGLKFRAIQGLRTDAYYYFLLEMTVPEEIQWNNDIVFEESSVVDLDWECIANFVSDSLENHTVLLEIQIYPEGKLSEEQEVTIQLKNLVQTGRAEVTDHLVMGEWKIPLTLPSAETDIVTFYPDVPVILNNHELYITKTDISPFQLRLYTNMEKAAHAVWGELITLSGIWYTDGTIIEESSINFSMSIHTDENEELCFEIPLEQAVNTDKIAGILLQDEGREQKIYLNRQKESQTNSDTDETSLLIDSFKSETQISELQLLCVGYGNVILADEQYVYLWDAECGRVRELCSLAEYGYSKKDGGEVAMDPGNYQLLILPSANSSTLYLYEVAGKKMLELEAEQFWPWPTYENYKNNFREITALIPDADERYSSQAFSFHEAWYYLYSEDGSIHNMELKVRN